MRCRRRYAEEAGDSLSSHFLRHVAGADVSSHSTRDGPVRVRDPVCLNFDTAVGGHHPGQQRVGLCETVDRGIVGRFGEAQRRSE